MNTTPDPKAPVVAWVAREETDYAIELSREDIADTFADLEYTDPEDNTLKLISGQRILEMSDAEIVGFVFSLWNMPKHENWSLDMGWNISIAFGSLQERLYRRGDVGGSRLSFHAIDPDGKTECPLTIFGELEMYSKFVDDITEMLEHLENITCDASDNDDSPAELITSLRERIDKLTKQQANTSDDPSRSNLIASLHKQIEILTKRRDS